MVVCMEQLRKKHIDFLSKIYVRKNIKQVISQSLVVREKKCLKDLKTEEHLNILKFRTQVWKLNILKKLWKNLFYMKRYMYTMENLATLSSRPQFRQASLVKISLKPKSSIQHHVRTNLFSNQHLRKYF